MAEVSIDLVAHALETRARALIEEIAKTERKDIAVALLFQELPYNGIQR